MNHMGMTGKMWSILAGLSVLSITKVAQLSIEISLCFPKAKS